MEIDYKSIGDRIRAKRIEKGITQQKLSEISGTEPSNISHIERGATKLSLPTLVNIANALECTVDELLCDSIYRSKSVFLGEVESYIKDCSEYEIRIVTDVVKAVVKSLRERSIFNHRK
ncbi:MAG: helix-turn-helix transcriptional regulator [Firmicutes bacterium]|nr:helix-turn-helix transcriptional regulator [Bacillota bacterium]